MSEERVDVRKAFAAYLGIFARGVGYWKAGLAVCGLAAIVGLVYGVARRPSWTSSTRVRVVSSRVGAGAELGLEEPSGPDLGSRLKQFVLSRRFLEEIIDERGLYRDLAVDKGLTREEVVDYMRGKVHWEAHGDDGFSFYFTDRDPAVARDVCASLATRFIDEQQGGEVAVFRTKLGRVARQVEEVEGRLERAEERLTRFKERNADLIGQMRREQLLGGAAPAAEPEAAAAGASAETRLSSEDSAELRRLRIRLRAMEENAEALRARRAAPPSPAAGPLSEERARADEALREARESYSQLRARLRDPHPDVVAAKARVSRAEGRVRELDARVRDRPAASPGPSPELASLERDIERARAEVRRLSRDEAEARAARPVAAPAPPAPTGPTTSPASLDVDELASRRLETVPEVATALARLESEVTPLRDRYQQLGRQRLELEFQVDQRAEGGLQYVVIDPANLPSRPDGPRRATFAAAFAAAGVLLGLAVMALLGLVDNRIYRPADVARLDHTPLLGTVPDFETGDEGSGPPFQAPSDRAEDRPAPTEARWT